jgi:hypothetical protein
LFTDISFDEQWQSGTQEAWNDSKTQLRRRRRFSGLRGFRVMFGWLRPGVLVMQLALQHSLVYQDTDEAGKRFPNVS